MPHRNALPLGFRIIRVYTDIGTAHGDERTAWELQRWTTTTTQRRGILRRNHTTTGWHTVETADPALHDDAITTLAETARTIYRQEHPQP